MTFGLFVIRSWSTLDHATFSESSGSLSRYKKNKPDFKIYSETCIYLFIWGFTSLSTLYRSYHDG